MQNVMFKIKSVARDAKAIFVLLTLSIVIASCHKDENNSMPSASSTNFNRVNLVSNNSQDSGARVDPNLINGWGIAFSPTGNPWLSSEGGGVSVALLMLMRQATNNTAGIHSIAQNMGGHPTGTVFNGSATAFVLPGGGVARFIFVGDDGVISGWSSGNCS